MTKLNVVCAVIIENDKVYCCRRGAGRALEGFWEFPGGKIEKGELSCDALIREIREELKTEIKVGLYIANSEYVYPETPQYKSYAVSLTAYECELVSGNLELSEHTEAKWLALSELNSVEWAPADAPILDEIKRRLKRQNFTITKDNGDGTRETVWTANCSEVTAMREFGRIILEQGAAYRSGELKKWRILRLFGEDGEQIAQES